jgi:putative membrane fusion protein
MSFTAYTLKDEKVLTSEYSGGVMYLAKNAGKVNPGDELARVYSQPVDESVRAKSELLDKCIEILEKSVIKDNFTAGESSTTAKELQALYYNLMRAITSGDANKLSSNYGELLVLLNKMYSYANGGGDVKALLEDYKRQRDELSSLYKGDFVTEKAEDGGYFFKAIDGYENIYSSAYIENMTYDSFSEMISREPESISGYGKMMQNYLWYLAVPTVKGISDSYVPGETYSVQFPDDNNRTLKMTLADVIYDKAGSKSVMLFSCGTLDASFNYLRIQRVEIVSRDISGFRIPESAVCEVGGTTGVYILKDGMATFRKITVLYEGDGYYIVSSDYTASDGYYVYIEQNDSIITDCKNMYEGKVIE